MNRINVFTKVMGYVDSNGQENIENYIVQKEVDKVEFVEVEVCTVLTYLITYIKKQKIYFSKEKDADKAEKNNRLESLIFSINIEDEKGNVLKVISEKEFFETIVITEKTTSLLLDYINVTAVGEEGIRIWGYDEYDLEPPAGTYAILALVERDKKRISEYIKFLRTNDLDHEVDQTWDIKSIIEKYSWCKETTALAIARNISCCGQVGKEDFNYFLENGLQEYVEENRAIFIELILLEFKTWDRVLFRIQEGYKKYYIRYVVDYVDHFKNVLTLKEIENIKQVLLEQWEEYHNKL